jgi:hypothetical protein
MAQPDYDYDAWKAANPGVKMAPGQHYPDTYKLPNHPTFSDESMYSTPNAQGGHWEQQQDKTWTFTPGAANLQHFTPEQLQDYFKRNEPGNRLIMANTDTDTPGTEGTTGESGTPPKPDAAAPDTSAPDTPKASDIPSPPVQTQSLSPQGAPGGWHPDTSQLTGGTTAGQTDQSIAAYLGIPSFGEPSKLKTAEGKPIVSDEEMRQAVIDQKANNAEKINAINDNTAAQRNLYEKLGKLGHPGLPDLQDIPKTPRSELRSSFEVFRNPLMLAAVLGTLTMKGHAKTAMQAASGAMEGFQQGDEKRVKLENERFKQEIERLKANNKVALDRYKAKIEDKKLEGQDYLNQIHGLAMELDHKVMASEAAKGNFQMTWDIYKGIKTLDEKLAEAKLKRNQQVGDTGDISNADERRAQDIANYKAPPISMYSRSGKLNQEALQVMNRAHEINPSYDEKKYSVQKTTETRRSTANISSLTSALSKMQQQKAAVDSFSKTALGNFNTVIALSKKIDTTGVPMLEKWIRAGKKSAGDSDMQAFEFQWNIATAELARALRQPNLTGVLTNEQLEGIEKAIPLASNTASLQKIYDLANADVQRRKMATEAEVTRLNNEIQGAARGEAPKKSYQDMSDDELNTEVSKP